MMSITVRLEELTSYLTGTPGRCLIRCGVAAADRPARLRSERRNSGNPHPTLLLNMAFVIVWAALVFTTTAGSAAGDATPPLARYLPTETTAFLSTADFQTLDKRLQTTFAGKMADAPEMSKFMEQFQIAATDSPASLPAFGVSWSDLRKIATGSVALAVTGAGEQDMGFVLLVESTGRDDEVQAIFDAINQSLDKAGATRSKSQIEGQQVETVEIPGSQASDPAVTRVVFKSDSLLVISDRRLLVEGVLRRLSGQPTASLAQQPVFTAVVQAGLPADAIHAVDVHWFVAPWRHLDLLVAAGKAERNEELAGWRSQGFDVIQAVGGSLRVAHGDRDFDTTTVVHAPGPRRLTAEALAFQPLPQITAPSWLPADAATFTAVGWDLAAAFRAYGHFFDWTYAEGESGVFDDVLLDILEEEGGPQVDVRKELIEQLRNPLIAMTAPMGTREAPVNRTVFSISTADEQRVARAVRRMLEGDQDVSSITIDNHQAWVFREMLGEDEESSAAIALGPDLSGVAICAAKQQVWTASDVALLTKTLSAEQTAPDRCPGLAQVTEIVQREAEGKAIAWQYSNLQQRLLSPYEQLRARNAMEEFSLLGLFMATIFPSGEESEGSETPKSTRIDWTLLPAFDKVQAFLPPAGSWINQTDDGWLLHGFVLGQGPVK